MSNDNPLTRNHYANWIGNGHIWSSASGLRQGSRGSGPSHYSYHLKGNVERERLEAYLSRSLHNHSKQLQRCQVRENKFKNIMPLATKFINIGLLWNRVREANR